METPTESYKKQQSIGRDRMKIDALLNTGEEEPCTNSPRSEHHSIPSPTNSQGYHHSNNHNRICSSYSPSASISNIINTNSNTHSLSNSRGARGARGSGGPGSGPNSSSRDPYHTWSRERHGSASSRSSENSGYRRRPPRPKYEEEEMYFIWYHRVDLCQDWKDIRGAFNRQFPNRQRRGFQGIQCKFYRFIKDKECPALGEQRRMHDAKPLREGAAASMGVNSGAAKFGVRAWANVWYPWMREERGRVALQETLSTSGLFDV